VRLRSDAKLELISSVPLFAGCSKRELREIARLADEVDVPAGRVLITEGERVGREFLVIVEGSARVTRKGRRISKLGPGDWAGEIALIADVPRTAAVTATSPMRLLVVTARDFRSLLDASPSIAAKVLNVLGKRLAPTAP
jgi:CRP/FNR family transcriptional regulator, cyclic AMP receptor protein